MHAVSEPEPADHLTKRADDRRLSRVQRAKMPRAVDVLSEVAANNGVCTNLVPMHRTDTTTGQTSIIGVPCGSTLASKCPACAQRAKRLRMQQCREGWHLDDEPDLTPDEATDDQVDLIEWRAALEDARADADEAGDLSERDELDAAIADVSEQMLNAGIRGSLPHPADPPKPRRVRSTKRRQDAPNLPFRKVDDTTLGRTFLGNDGTVFRPSTFLTLTCDTYGRVKGDGTPVNPNTYDYQRAARDAIHFPRLVDRFWQNLRRVVGYDVQYFAAVEPQKRLAPHLHAAVRGTFPRALLKQVIAATYHQVWWPALTEMRFDPNTPDTFPVWDTEAGYVDTATGEVLPTFDDALDELDDDAEPLHVVRFGPVADIQGVTAGTKSANTCVGYLTKYLTKSVAECHAPETDAQKAHVDRLAAALRYEPCSERCANWLLYGIQPRNAKAGLTPGRCSGKAHRRETLGFVGRRVLVSRKWSGKTLTDHRADRKAHVLRVLGAVGKQVENADAYIWERAKPTDEDCPPIASLLMRILTDRLRWRQEYAAAQDTLADLSATQPTAA
ncbi:replication initiator [Cryptosporangium japonicum]|uniref:Replication initiator protein n=1 Tax=Cryptosporangium japonicum TaxID=80872 RepID=A0ABN0V3M8_9ACTN